MKLLLKIFVISFLFLFCISNSISQIKKKEDTPLVPTEQKRTEIGGFIGLGGNSQSGTYITDACQCEFDKGRGFGFTIGAIYESEIVRRLRWGGALAYDLRSFWASYMEREAIEYKSEINGRKENVNVLFRNRSDVGISFLTLMPFVKYLPSKFLFFRLGLGASLVLGSSQLHTKELLDKTAKLSTGEIVETYIPGVDGNVATVEDGEFPQVNSLQFSMEPAIGLNFPLGEKLNFSPAFQYSIPLTKFSENGSDIKLSAWRIILEFKYDITPEEN